MIRTALKRTIRGASGLLQAKGHIDAVAGHRFSGWAFARGHPIRIEALVGGKVIATTVPEIRRDDVALAFPGQPSAERSGFVLNVPASAVPPGEIVNVAVLARPLSPLMRPTRLAEACIAGSHTIERISQAPETGIVGPFPKGVIDAVAALWPEACRDLESDGGQRLFADMLYKIMRTPGLRSAPAIADYARYLHATWAHCNFVDRFFPTENPKARQDSADFHCKPNSILEIFSIVHQLYVLKSYGLKGDFAEFGCFKGFSSAMLSLACKQLGLRMHIFDSFEGLPPAEGSGYQAGDYAGSLDEVRANVTRFGSADVVEFHQGFFSDTFRTYRPPRLMCLWMDVDLEVSARDLMVIADRLNPRATLFSHECTADMFVSGEIKTIPRPDNPIPPVLARFEELGMPLMGRFMRGNTGAFWPRSGGIQALDNSVLLDLVRRVCST